MPTDLSPALRDAVEVMARGMCAREDFDPDVVTPEGPMWENWTPDATAALRALIEAGFVVERWRPIEEAHEGPTNIRPDLARWRLPQRHSQVG